MKTRTPFVSGRFYPNEKNQIFDFIEKNLSTINNKTKSIAFISPHAGYMFSGKSALKLFEKNIIPENIFILSPNHTGYGEAISIDTNDRWKTPISYININKNASNYLLNNFKNAKASSEAQNFEHAIEVQIPFIQYFNKEATIIPITIAETNINILMEFSFVLSNCIKEFGVNKSLIISSSDMTHFETAQSAEQKDELAINKILELDPISFYNTVHNNKISMCGVYPTTLLLFTLNNLGLNINANLIDYTNSGAVTNDYSDVVSYASIEFLLN